MAGENLAYKCDLKCGNALVITAESKWGAISGLLNYRLRKLYSAEWHREKPNNESDLKRNQGTQESVDSLKKGVN